MYELAGKIKLINDTQSFPSGFTKREFVVTTANDKYPQDIKFEIVKEKCSLLDQFEPSQEVQLFIDIRGNRLTEEIALFINDEFVGQWSEGGTVIRVQSLYAGKGPVFGFVVQT